jgi:STE24 endopeptidase
MTATSTGQGYNGGVRRTAVTPVVFALLAALGWWLWQARLPGPVRGVPAQRMFSAAQLARARDYRTPSYLLAVAALLLPVLAGLALAARGGDRLALGRRPWPAAAAAAFLFALATSAAALPVAFALHVRAHDQGLDLQSGTSWAVSAVTGLVVTAAAVAAVYLLAWAVAARAPGRPWLAVGLAAWAAVAVFSALQPLVWDPLFMSTRPLRDPAARALVARLERRMHAHPDSVSVDDASSRSTEENAFVDGLGPTVRMVIDDTSLRHSTPAQLQALVAHELGHVQRLHTLKGVLWFGVLGLPLLWLLFRVVEPVAARRYAGGMLDPRAVPLVLAGVLVLFTLTVPVQNLISRRYEAEADWAALQATRNGAGMVSLQRRLAVADVESLQPPAWAVDLLFDHPPVMSRIAVARSVERPGAPTR